MKNKFFIMIPKNPKSGDVFYNAKENLFYTFCMEEWAEGTPEDWLIGIDLGNGKDN